MITPFGFLHPKTFMFRVIESIETLNQMLGQSRSLIKGKLQRLDFTLFQAW
jgi:hypothetical protein